MTDPLERHPHFITPEQAARLRAEARQREISASAIVRLALERFFADPQVDQLLDQLRQQGREQ